MAAPDKGYPRWVRHAGIGLELAGAVAGFALIGYWIDSAVQYIARGGWSAASSLGSSAASTTS